MMGRVVCVTVAFWLIWHGQAAACFCAGGNDVRERFRSAQAVFDGVIRSSRIIPHPDGGVTLYLSTVFQITRPLKGAGRGTREIAHSLTFERLCGVEFVPGERVLVFEHRNIGSGDNYCFMPSASVLDKDTSLQEAIVEEVSDAIGEAVGAVLADSPMARFRDPPAGGEEGEAEEEEPEEAEPVQPAARKRPTKGLDRSSALFLDLRARSVKSLEEDLEALNVKSRRIIKDPAVAATRQLLNSAVGRARDFEEYRDYEHMEMAYSVVSRLAPLDPEGPAGRARALYMLGRFAEAKPHLDAALRLNPRHPLARKLRAHTMLILEGRPARRVTDYSRLGPRGFLPPEASPYLPEDGPRRVSVDLGRRRLPGLSFYGAEIDRFTAARALLARADFSHASIREGTFQGADLSGADFTRAAVRGNFEGARLLRINAPYAGFGGSFRRANLSHAKAPHSAWRGANFAGTLLSNADLSFADLTNAQLQGTDLRRAKTRGIILKGARIDCATKLPAGTDIRKAQAIPVAPVCSGDRQNRDFSGMDWESTEFSNLDLPGANFSGGTYQYAKFDGGTFAGADFSTALFDSTDFYGANLQRADFSRTGPYYDEISRAFGVNDDDDFKLVGAWFAGADLTDADFSNAMGVGIFHGWDGRSFGGKLLPPAKLLRTNFSGTAVLLSSFLVSDLFGEFPAQEDADISTAIFDGTRIRCQFGDWHGAILVVKGESLPAETRDFYPPEMLAKYTPEQRAVLEERNAFLRKEKAARREFFRKAVLKERNVVRHIAKAWPTAKFEQCEAYFAPAGP